MDVETGVIVVSHNPDDGRVSVVAPDCFAIRDSKGIWSRGAIAPADAMEDFVLIRDTKEASLLWKEAEAALASSAGRSDERR